MLCVEYEVDREKEPREPLEEQLVEKLDCEYDCEYDCECGDVECSSMLLFSPSAALLTCRTTRCACDSGAVVR